MTEHANGGPLGDDGQALAEPWPHGCEFYIPLSPERKARNASILAETLERLADKD